MLTRDFRRPEERTRHPLKPLFSHFFLPTPTTIARLDIRLRRAALYPAELWVRAEAGEYGMHGPSATPDCRSGRAWRLRTGRIGIGLDQRGFQE